MNVDHLIATTGYPILFVFVGSESFGIPLPGETALIAAGAYAGSTGKLSPWVIFVVAATAAVIGDNIGFLIGDKGGYALARRFGPKVRLSERRLKVARYIFDEHGVKVVFFGRFVAVLRAYAAFLAGTTRMAWSRFLPANAAGGVLWAAIYTTLAYEAGSWIRRFSGTIDVVLGVLAVVVTGGGLLVVRKMADQLSEKAEARFPGPLR